MIGLLAVTIGVTGEIPAIPAPLSIEKRNPTYITGERLEAMCKEPSDGDCVRYIEGASDVYAILHNATGMGSACVPQSTNSLQARDVVIAYMKQHPEARVRTGASVVAAALNTAFPCSK